MIADQLKEKRFELESIQNYLLAAISCLFLCMVIYYTYLGWIKEANLDFISGVWLNLANELKEGYLYRPAYSDVGYGGPEYAPLFFSLHAVLIGVGLSPKYSGLMLVAFINIATMVAIYKLLQHHHNNFKASLFLALCTLISATYQFSMTSLRPDALATALILWSSYFCMKADGRKTLILIASLFLVLAFATKITAIYGFVVLAAFLFVRKRHKAMFFFSFSYLAGVVLLLVLLKYAGDDTVISGTAKTIGSEINISSLVASPMRLIYVLNQYDTGCFFVFFIASVLLLINFKKTYATFPGLLFIIVVPITCVILSKVGTGSNHLTDLHAASLIFIGYHLKGGLPLGINAARSVAIVLLLISFQPIWFGIRKLRNYPDFYLTALADNLSSVHGDNILSENPYLSSAIGKKPYVIDPWMCRVIRERYVAFTDSLLEKIRNQAFDSIVLITDPRKPEGVEFLDRYHFGRGFVEHLNRYYTFLNQVQDQLVYVKR